MSIAVTAVTATAAAAEPIGVWRLVAAAAEVGVDTIGGVIDVVAATVATAAVVDAACWFLSHPVRLSVICSCRREKVELNDLSDLRLSAVIVIYFVPFPSRHGHVSED